MATSIPGISDSPAAPVGNDNPNSSTGGTDNLEKDLAVILGGSPPITKGNPPKEDPPESVPATDKVELEGGDKDKVEAKTESPKEGEPPLEAAADDEPEIVVDEETGERNLIKEVQKADPKFFKKWPEFRTALFEANEYKKYMPTVDDAKEAAETLQNVTALDEDLSKGEPGRLLQYMESRDPESVRQFAIKFPQVLMKADISLFKEMMHGPLAAILNQAKADAQAAKNEHLGNAVNWIAGYFFNTPDGSIPQQKPADPRILAEREKFENERKTDLSRRSERFTTTVSKDIKSAIIHEIKDGLDPKNVLPKELREAVIDGTYAKVMAKMKEDVDYLKQMQSIMSRAAKLGFPEEYEARVKSAALARARNLLIPIRQKLRADMVGTNGNGNGEDKTPTTRNTPTTRRIPAGGSAPSSANRLPNPKDVDWSKTDHGEFLTTGKYVPRK